MFDRDTSENVNPSGMTASASEAEIVSLIERAQAGDPLAFDRLYEVYAHSIFRYLYHRLNEREVAEDLTGEAFLRLIENIGNFRIGPRDQKAIFSGWFFRIAHNLMVDHLRREARQTEMPESVTSTEEQPVQVMEHSLRQSRLRAALNQLTQDQQDVVVLRFFDELSNAEVAQIMGRTEGAIKALQHRALAALSRVLLGEA